MLDGVHERGTLGSDKQTEPDATDRQATHAARRDKALAIIVLAIETKLLYLVGVPSCGPEGGLGETGQPVSKEIMGKQAGTQTQELFSMKLTTHKNYD